MRFCISWRGGACLLVTLFLVLWESGFAFAHPHAFVETYLTAVFDEKGLAGVRQKWRMDPMLTVTILDFIHENHDGKLDESEVEALRTRSFSLLSEYDYFTHVQVDGKVQQLQNATHFDAYLEKGKMVYEFFLPLNIEAGKKFHTAAVASYDVTFYTCLFVCTPGSDGAGVDPLADPQFAANNAPANPGDFDRFKDAVGLDDSQGGITLQGPTDKFIVETTMEEVPSMAYFHGQIIPSAAIIRFKLK